MTRRLIGAVLLAVASTAAACAGTSPPRPATPYLDEVADRVVVDSDLTYGEGPVSVDPRLAAKLHRPGLAVDRPRRLKLDLYEPAGLPGDHPALVVVHGGGFGFGDKRLSSAVDLARSFARRGYVTASIDYRLLAFKYCYGKASTGLLPGCYRAALAARDDAEAAVAWLRAHAARFHVDPGRVAIAGSSAGGITAWLVGTDDDAGRDTGTGVEAFFSLSGAVPHGRFGDPGDAPGLLAVSRDEEAFPWSQASARTLARSEVPSYLDVIDGGAHAPYFADRERLLTETACFFSRALHLAGSDRARAAVAAECAHRLDALAVDRRHD